MRDAASVVPSAQRATFDAEAARAYLRRCERVVRRHADALTRLDAALGDGDHGDNLVIGFDAVREELLDVEDSDDVGGILQRVGTALVTSVGGASGPLYGAAFMEAGFAARGRRSITMHELATLLEAAAAGLARRGRCAVGDKTIYDAMRPAADALRAAIDDGRDDRECLSAMVRAAARGMRATTEMVARRGLAMRLGERSRGHRDPGAASCFLLLAALATPVARGDRSS